MTDTGLPARRAALSILSNVLQKRRPLDAGLDQLGGLATRDAGFARALVSETLRHMGALDAVLRKFMAKPLAPHKAGAARSCATDPGYQLTLASPRPTEVRLTGRQRGSRTARADAA